MQQKNKFIHSFLSILMVFFLMVSSIQYQPVAAQGEGGDIRRELNAENGKVNFIGGKNGLPVQASKALGIPAGERPANPGKALVQMYGREFGLKNPASELAEKRSVQLDNGRMNFRYQQTYNGIPVVAGGLIVNTNEKGDLYSITGEASSDLALSTEPTISSESAQEYALRLMIKKYGGEASDYSSTKAELWVYDESLLVPSRRPAALVWRMEVTPVDVDKPIREFVLIDAQTGNLALSFNQVDTAWTGSGQSTPRTHESSSAPLAYPPPTPFGATRTTIDAHNNVNNGDDTISCSDQDLNCTSGADPDADAAHLYAGLVWALYDEKHGRNSIDNGVDPGMPIVSVVNYDSGYDNAFWDGSKMTYGDGYGFVYADDVVAHELTHGVTDYESALLYFYQSGAINESFSDLWGEYFDQTNGEGTDTAGVKWLVGEDITELGAIRSMSNPPAFGDPDKMLSPQFYKGEGDNGGVHINSGVNNKAVYLMVDGGLFNGKTVVPLGWDKTAAIYYEAQTNLLGNGANYSDLYYALQQACSTLIGGAQGITLDNCLNVKNALDAVQMNSPITIKTQVTAPLCPAGMTAKTPMPFEDNMEGAITTNWNTSSFRWQSSTDIASSPTKSMWGNDLAPFLWESADMKNGVLVQPNMYLHFDHSYDFEYAGSFYFDGGVLEYTKDGGSSWQDAGALYSAGANYGGTIFAGFGNPLGGRRGFVGSTYPYYFEPTNLVSSRYSLASLVGQTVRFRFQFATDDIFQYLGWHIDDVKIYQCIGTPGVPVLQLPANNALVLTYTPTLNWGDSAPAIDNYQVQVATSNTFTSPLVDVSNIVVSEYTTPALDENTLYYWRVRAFNEEDATNNWSLVRSFRTVLLPPVPVSPGGGGNTLTLRPTFTWTNPNDDGPAPINYTVQVSTNSGFTAIVHTGTAATTSYTPAANLLAGQPALYWRVRANGLNGPSAYSSAVMSFATPATVPPAPTLSAPANGFLTTNYSPALSWTIGVLPVGTTVDHYQVQIDDDQTFGSPLVYNPAGAGTTFNPAPDLASNKKWYWRVRTYNNVGEISSWSLVRNFRTALVPPGNLSPADNATVNSLRPTFNWDDVTGATGYTIQIANNPGFAPILRTGNTTASQYTPTVDLPKNTGTELYWRVQTKGLNGPSAFTPSNAADRSFTTPANPPAVPTLTGPASNFLTTDYSPLLSWNMPVTSPAFDHFVVQVDDNLTFSSPTDYVTPNASLNYSITPDLASNTKWYWRVRAVNLGGEMGNWSTSRIFRTALVPPGNLTPADNATVNSLRPTFNWDDVTGATGYTIQIANNPGFAPILRTGNTTVSQYTPTVDLPKNTGTELYWRVQTKGLNGPSAFTPSNAADRSFTTPANPPAVPTLTGPASNFLTTDYSPLLSWNMPVTSPAFDHFVVQVDDNLTFSSPTDYVTPNASLNYSITPDLASNTKWYWRVRAVNLGGEMGNWSASRIFRTALTVPVLEAPSNGYPINTFWPLFNWADVSGAAGYNIQISVNNIFTQVITNANTTGSNYQSLSGFCGGITLYWRVRATGLNGPSNWSAPRSFIIPSCP